MYSYDRRASTNANFLRGRSGWELRVIGELSAEYETPDFLDPLETAALVVDNVKKKYGDLWRAMMETNLAPKAVADTLARMKDRALSGRPMFAADDGLTQQFRDSIFMAIKRVGDGVRAMGLGSVVKYNPQERIDDDHRATHARFNLRFDHPKINPAYRPAIFFYWDKSKEQGVIESASLVWKNKHYDNLPLAKMAGAMLTAADDIVADLKRQLGEPEPTTEAWSVVTLGKGHSYATEVDTFSSKSKAEQEARDRGDCYVVKGTQMWNEPLGQVEEHDRPAQYRFFR